MLTGVSKQTQEQIERVENIVKNACLTSEGIRCMDNHYKKILTKLRHMRKLAREIDAPVAMHIIIAESQLFYSICRVALMHAKERARN